MLIKKRCRSTASVAVFAAIALSVPRCSCFRVAVQLQRVAVQQGRQRQQCTAATPMRMAAASQQSLYSGNPLLGPIPLLPNNGMSKAEEQQPQEAVTEGVDLFARTWESLDFGVVLEALSNECRTAMGCKLSLVPNFRTEVAAVQELYRCVEEVYSLPETVPIGSGMDIEAVLILAAKGTTLEPPELREVSACLSSLQDLVAFFDREDSLRWPTPHLKELVQPIYLDPQLVELLSDAFDPEGKLCGKKFPEIANLRKRIDRLYDRLVFCFTLLNKAELLHV
jgi:hypothetical protein